MSLIDNLGLKTGGLQTGGLQTGGLSTSGFGNLKPIGSGVSRSDQIGVQEGVQNFKRQERMGRRAYRQALRQNNPAAAYDIVNQMAQNGHSSGGIREAGAVENRLMSQFQGRKSMLSPHSRPASPVVSSGGGLPIPSSPAAVPNPAAGTAPNATPPAVGSDAARAAAIQDNAGGAHLQTGSNQAGVSADGPGLPIPGSPPSNAFNQGHAFMSDQPGFVQSGFYDNGPAPAAPTSPASAPQASAQESEMMRLARAISGSGLGDVAKMASNGPLGSQVVAKPLDVMTPGMLANEKAQSDSAARMAEIDQTLKDELAFNERAYPNAQAKLDQINSEKSKLLEDMMKKLRKKSKSGNLTSSPKDFWPKGVF
jgi:hypothetical protein